MMGADKWAPGTGLNALLGWDEGHSRRDIGTTLAQEAASWVLFRFAFILPCLVPPTSPFWELGHTDP